MTSAFLCVVIAVQSALLCVVVVVLLRALLEQRASGSATLHEHLRELSERPPAPPTPVAPAPPAPAAAPPADAHPRSGAALDEYGLPIDWRELAATGAPKPDHIDAATWSLMKRQLLSESVRQIDEDEEP